MMSFSRASVEFQPHGDRLLAHRAHLQVLCAVRARLMAAPKSKVLGLVPADWTGLWIAYIAVLSRRWWGLRRQWGFRCCSIASRLGMFDCWTSRVLLAIVHRRRQHWSVWKSPSFAKKLKTHCCLELFWDLHQCWKSKFCLLFACGYRSWHDLCEVHKLKIVKCPRRYVIIELPHHVPWPITNSNKHNWKRVVTSLHNGIYGLPFLWAQPPTACFNAACNLEIS